VTPRPGRPGRGRPYLRVTDDSFVEALQGLEPWRSVGDSLDGDLAVIAYDVPPTSACWACAYRPASTHGR
jgi:hypothetical protein